MAETMERIEQARKAADAHVKPWQTKAKPGDCFVTVSDEGLVILGEVLDVSKEERLRHYRFCRCQGSRIIAMRTHIATSPPGDKGVWR